MLSILANHNDDIKRLIEKGYAVSLDSNYLVVRDVFYVDSSKNLQRGAIVSKLVFLDNHRVQLEDHQVLFCGAHPCELNGEPIPNLGGGATTLTLASPDLVVQRSFSNKPPEGFPDLFEKIESYVNIISGPAIALHGANPYTFASREDSSASVFKVRDTLTSRAEIGDLAQLFRDEVIAIIGLGGTGAYTLDFIAKTPVKEIRGFDGDVFHAHTAFRSPGKLDNSDNGGELGKSKAQIYQKRYEGFREGVNMQPKCILADSDADMQGVTFAFVCVDNGAARKGIIELLMRLNIPFIDVGMGLDRAKVAISGTVRVTYFPVDGAANVLAAGWVPLDDIPTDVYRTNIQIAELNALNACMAVIRYKQIKGFYADETSLRHLLFNLDAAQLAWE